MTCFNNLDRDIMAMPQKQRDRKPMPGDCCTLLGPPEVLEFLGEALECVRLTDGRPIWSWTIMRKLAPPGVKIVDWSGDVGWDDFPERLRPEREWWPNEEV